MASYCLLVLVLEERVYVPSATVQCATLRVVKRLWLCACVFMHNAEAARLCVRLCCGLATVGIEQTMKSSSGGPAIARGENQQTAKGLNWWPRDFLAKQLEMYEAQSYVQALLGIQLVKPTASPG
eukprot:TRINITY_DN6984_c0_g1_i7.p2 TRINITY_DN6984_c0_g1~~TRINITY_DN6984_c0_g1_i7.p2  ORF type:complete len:125 (-),score=6.68 TRINITY_DN6984_c0_g1_i7:382-756(-)